jgi:SNF2 family DNA or RNA helicase
MLVIEKAKALLLQLKNPDRVLNIIPTARKIHVGGKDLVAVPHKADEVRVLRNLGFKAPAPILHYYDWPGPYTPFIHQQQTSAFLTMHKRALVLNQIGTGKTMSALWSADYLMRKGLVKKVLILSPLSTLERVWADGVFLNFPDRTYAVLHGTAERRARLLNADVDFYIVNHDGFKIIAQQAKHMFDLVIVDEATVFRNPQTQRFKSFNKWMDEHPNIRLWLMTGTPTPNEPTDAWALAKLVGSPYIPKTYTGFRDQVMTKIGQYKFVPRPNAIEIVSNVLHPAVRFTRDECLDLPPTVFQTRGVVLTADQRQHYDAMWKSFVTEVQNEGAISAANEAVKLNKLVQISCGVAYGNDGRNIYLDCKPRVDAVREVITEVNGKVIVFVPLTGTLHMLEKELAKDWTVAVVNGEVPAHKRNEIFQSFQNSPDPQVLIAHPATMAHGLTLTAASTVIWYGPINSNEIYTQANGRIERIGKVHSSLVVHIEATPLESKMYQRLEKKQSLQGLLLDMIQLGQEKNL